MNNLIYNGGTENEKGWLITEHVFDSRYLGKCESIFCQGNGVMGVRNALEESYIGETRGTFVNGTFNKFDENEVTELPNMPDVTEIDLWLDGYRFSLETGEILSYERTLNLYTGEVIRTAVWKAPNGKTYHLRFRRFVSLDNKNLIGNICEIEAADTDCEIKIVSGISDRMTNTGSQHFSEGKVRVYDEKYIESIQETIQSGVRTAVYTCHELTIDGKRAEMKKMPSMERRKVDYRYQLILEKGKKLVLEKISGIYTTRDPKYAAFSEETAKNDLQKDSKADFILNAEEGYEALFEKSRECWKKFWDREDIKIESKSDMDQLGIHFALYHLNIMISRADNRVGIGAKALTGEGYKGHSFWDTEVFLLPYYLYTDPKAARTLLEYRYKGLFGARKKAQENGFDGAQYPWEAAWIDDGEVTPLWGAADVVTGETMPILTGQIEIHITADVAFAVNEYYQATKDMDFMLQYGCEILAETAKFWMSKMEWKNGRYEILDVIGPDEYKEHVNNNAYTNYLAHTNMMLAKNWTLRIQKEYSQKFEELNNRLGLEKMMAGIDEKMNGLYLPQPNEDGIVPQFDHYFDLKYLNLKKYKESSVVGTIYHDYNQKQINEYQVSKQGDIVVLLFLLNDLFDKEIRKKNYEYYEERSLHDSSLSKCTHGIIAADLDLMKDAYRFYQESAMIDLGPEMKSSDAGIHSASMGGIWQSVVMGFGGVRIANGELQLNVNLPEEWESLSYPVIWEGNHLRVKAVHGGVQIYNAGEEFSAIVNHNNVVIKSGENQF